MNPSPSTTTIPNTRRFWQERTGRPVSEEDAQEAVRNVTAFFDLLANWTHSMMAASLPQAKNSAVRRRCWRTMRERQKHCNHYPAS